MPVTGTTRVVVHLTYPAKHLRTPSLFNPLLERLGHDGVLVPWEVSPDNLASAWAGLRGIENLAGVIVTVPHKIEVAHLCDELLGIAEVLKVCNVARRLPDGRFVGRMFDGEGFVRGLKNQGHDLGGRRVLLLGAGGAATGIAHALLSEPITRLVVANRSLAKAEALAAQLRTLMPGRDIAAGAADARGFDVVINATALGLKADDPLPLAADTLQPGTLVGEVVMNPDVTPLLEAAQARGCPIHKGVHMLTGQLELLADYLFGAAPGR
ncbi:MULTISPECIES: shikimate dehydrogenase family protein [Pseudomonas]|jgi:shikimate dehydrogenase|uniref:shikimate dehydrogenase (NADP(+)) n=2 Tax=Pseudomonas TaxID=286 RepID=A0A0B5KCD0_PSEDL|nr:MULTISPECIES: shikimate dehydrogenase [Pseudomonas]AEJ12801.1 shikimate/quinate 5-dehydrogenase [Pseudomonas putida S16]AHZ77010.1 shikimate/quinate 5-dehydrogenase [Pseudomonas putida]AJG14100.1 shikimate/quinate 5-dehydrogenase [Pseudomonas plecoglossicida]ESW36398.1 shkimate dehydrogenase [Pseudomonas taiwanensis SJ9]KYC25410.1 shikimate dehydrogenase [Pseudomonas sp. ABFPK]